MGDLNELLDALSTEDSLSELLDTLPVGEGRPDLTKPNIEGGVENITKSNV